MLLLAVNCIPFHKANAVLLPRRPVGALHGEGSPRSGRQAAEPSWAVQSLPPRQMSCGTPPYGVPSPGRARKRGVTIADGWLPCALRTRATGVKHGGVRNGCSEMTRTDTRWPHGGRALHCLSAATTKYQ
jgi:hypothetical protein